MQGQSVYAQWKRAFENRTSIHPIYSVRSTGYIIIVQYNTYLNLVMFTKLGSVCLSMYKQTNKAPNQGSEYRVLVVMLATVALAGRPDVDCR